MRAERPGEADRAAGRPSIPNYYEILGVHPLAPLDLISAAYWRLVGHAQAARSSDESVAANVALLHLNKAYQTLIDSAARAAYNDSIGLSTQPLAKARARRGLLSRLISITHRPLTGKYTTPPVDYYEVLRVHKSADASIIAEAYLTMRWHYLSLVNSGREPARLLSLLEEAYTVLSDAARRATYDRAIAAKAEPQTDEGGEMGGRRRPHVPPPGLVTSADSNPPPNGAGEVQQTAIGEANLFSKEAAVATRGGGLTARALPDSAIAWPNPYPVTGSRERGREFWQKLIGRLARLQAAAVVGTLLLILTAAVVLRVTGLNDVGFNSDEAVYSGQAASIASDPELTGLFPTFRAHPLLFQSILSIGYQFGVSDLMGRLLAAAFGVATVYVTYKLGSLLYGRKAGLLAALFMALMPYHVVVSRQVLLDGPMAFFATLALYFLARFTVTQRPAWLYAAGAAMGLTFLSKETGILLLGAIYAFLALNPGSNVRIKDIAIAVGVMILVIAPFPLSIVFAGKAETGGQYLVWQLFRRPNHDWAFYPSTVPEAIGPLVIVAAIAGFWLLRRNRSWRETLLLSWIAVPVMFFQLWPVKGFQYLLPIAPAIAVLAGRTIATWSVPNDVIVRVLRVPLAWAIRPLAIALIALTLIVPSWHQIHPSTASAFLAGSGGVPGGREAGSWVKANVPAGAKLMTVGPSMANILQFYGHRVALGLSVSPNPLHRNPSYEPIINPDQAIRSGEIQYVVWDSFSASRSTFFSDALLRYADRYHGRIVHTEPATAAGADGQKPDDAFIVIYEVRP